MTTIFLLFFVLFLDNASVAQCDYTVKLYDHHHDGWSGNSLMVRVNNVNVADITLANGGGPYNYTIAAQPNDVISLLFKRNGNWYSECRYELYDPNNVLIAERDCSLQNTHNCGGPENVYGILACPSSEYCGVMTIDMFDGYGNGWAAANLDVYVNNSLYISETFQNLSYAWADREDISIAVRSNDLVDVLFNPVVPTSSNYNYIGYVIYDTNGDTIAQQISSGNAGLNNSLGLEPCFRSISNDFLNTSKIIEKSFSIYPSPVQGNLNLATEVEVTYYRITNVQGLVLQQGSYPSHVISVQNIPAGLYYFEAYTASKDPQVLPFVKQ